MGMTPAAPVRPSSKWHPTLDTASSPFCSPRGPLDAGNPPIIPDDPASPRISPPLPPVLSTYSRIRRADIGGNAQHAQEIFVFKLLRAGERTGHDAAPSLARNPTLQRGWAWFSPNPAQRRALDGAQAKRSEVAPYPATSATRSKSLASCRSASCLAGSPNTRFTRLPRCTAVRAPIWSVQRARFLYASIPRNSRAL